MKKLVFFGGFAVGYVLGARAGRGRYEQIARASGKFWNSTPVQVAVDRVRDVVPSPTEALTGAVRAVSKKVRNAAKESGSGEQPR